MTLYEFFTLTEMNNGLTSLSRVRELIAVMQKERDGITNNTTDSTRQRSVVASAIAATENKNCLDLFLQLDGLHFISNWLEDARKSSNDTLDTSSEESIIHLLRALEKLHVDYEKLVSYDIWTSVENLRVYSNPKVQDKARVLLESWKTKRDIVDASIPDVDKTGALIDGKARDSSDIRRDRESSPENATISREPSVKYNGHELARDNQVVSTSSDAVRSDRVQSAQNSNKILDPPTGDEKPLDHVSPTTSRHEILDTCLDFHDLKSKTSEGRSSAPNSVDDAEMKDVTEPSSQENSYAGSENLCKEGFDSDGKSVGDDASDANRRRSSNAFILKEKRGDVNHRMLSKSISSEKSWGKFLSGIRDDLSDDDVANNYAFGKRHTDGESGKKSVEIDYGIVDPLEVAMQVAMEVERDIVNYRELSQSPSEEVPKCHTPQPNSPDSMSRKKTDSIDGPPVEAANDSDSNSSKQSATGSENLDTNGKQVDVATSQVSEAAQEELATTDKSPCNFFDLNQELFSEDCSRPENLFPAPVSVVSASRATAVAPKFPGAPLQFEGNLGWKGSALTSAFRPASPRRMPESNFSILGISSMSKQQQEGCCLDFDLNVSESVDESSVETNSKRSEHLELDLNRTSEDGGALLDWRIGNFFPGGNWPQSSSNQPIMNIDLNDQPSFLNVKASQNFNFSGGFNPKPDESAISIMGTRVEVNQKDFFVSQTPYLQNSRIPEVAFDYNLGRTGNFVGIGSANPYSHSSVYGYSNIVPGPVMPFSGPVYGPGHHSMPYMVDSRGAPIVPQMMGSGLALPTAFSQPPFVINMNGPTTTNGVGPSQSGFDLNSGLLMESGSKDPTGLGLFSNSAQIRPIDGPSSQVTMSSSVNGKRKEPDNGCGDNYYPFKHYAPPWKQS